ncbi:MAG: hypothetical protein M0Z39_02265 [Actinomycetota bacterium]|jgi:hypothetical protein|nr:hypothetical protein [Actinomycetota bacterium]
MMDALERGTLPEEAFSDWVRELGLKAKTLHARRADLKKVPHIGDGTKLTLAGLELMYRYLKRLNERAPGDIHKNVTQALVHDLHVDDPTHITSAYGIIAPHPRRLAQNPSTETT